MGRSRSSTGLPGMRDTRTPAFLLGLSVALMLGAGPAQAEKVGVAAAVNPDAFSSLSGTPNKQLNIGKSIFYNERINTTDSGLVQVLLVDGSTFTVGPNSNLVIDRFVYDPRKKTGELVATFSKGTMRFIGGKLSKNEGGVKVNTPAGALAIRGGMVQGNVSGNKGLFSFLYGVQMSFRSNNGQTHNVYQNGYTLDLRGGSPQIRPTTPEDTNFFMTSLSPGSTGGTAGSSSPTGTNGTQPANYFSDSLDEIINEATATQIQDEIQQQIANLNKPSDDTGDPAIIPKEGTPRAVQTAAFGYASGIYAQRNVYERDGETFYGYPRHGTLTNIHPTEVGLLFKDNAFDGAQFDLYADVSSWRGNGGLSVTYSPVGNVDIDSPGELPSSGLFFGLTGFDLAENSITVFQDTKHFPLELANAATVTSGSAFLIGVTGAGEALCDSCSYLKWGVWLADVSYQKNGGDYPHINALVDGPGESYPNGGNDNVNIQATGWWVAAKAIPTVGQLPFEGFATYEGKTFGNASIFTWQGWKDYVATGDVRMTWNFQDRDGVLRVNNFRDAGHKLPSLNAWGHMKMPGVLEDTNKFSGKLFGKLGHGPWSSRVSGSAVGSFTANGNDKAAAAIGNWNASNQFYKASGIFGASRTAPITGPINVHGPNGPNLLDH
jgi:FecR-like protein